MTRKDSMENSLVVPHNDNVTVRNCPNDHYILSVIDQSTNYNLHNPPTTPTEPCMKRHH